MLILHALFFTLQLHAQRADSAVVRELQEKGVKFSNDNSVTLLMSGQEKFDDMFRAIS